MFHEKRLDEVLQLICMFLLFSHAAGLIWLASAKFIDAAPSFTV